MAFETVFTMDTSSIRYGPGVTREVGYEMKRLGASCVMLVVDPHLVESEAVATAHSSLRARSRTRSMTAMKMTADGSRNSSGGTGRRYRGRKSRWPMTSACCLCLRGLTHTPLYG